MNDTKHNKWMVLAIEQARKGWNRTQPNPSVGAVIVKNGKLLSSGYTLPSGGDHAEVQAIKNCPEEILAGSTIYVTLEPCSHHGKTPPCVDAIIRAGIVTVVIGTGDPNPLVSGNGVTQLRRHGISVIENVLHERISKMYDAFFIFITQKRSKITVKIAQSSNGAIAGPNREQVIITCSESRVYVHNMRAEADAILVGGQTVVIDNPKLDTRLATVPTKVDPIRVVIDHSGRLDVMSSVFRDDGRRVFAANATGRTYPKNIIAVELKKTTLSDNLRSLFEELYTEGIHHILIEPGGVLAQEILTHNLFDELYLFTAPQVITNGYTWNKSEGLEWKERLDFCTFEHIHSDTLEIFKNPKPFIETP